MPTERPKVNPDSIENPEGAAARRDRAMAYNEAFAECDPRFRARAEMRLMLREEELDAKTKGSR